jgi:hypothetical protein
MQGERRPAFFDQLIARGKKPLQAHVAVMRKLLHAIYGMFTTNKDFVAEKFYAVASETAWRPREYLSTDGHDGVRSESDHVRILLGEHERERRGIRMVIMAAGGVVDRVSAES